ncbi:hypothetical protein Cgig2_027700 [Carnegiea gigantea]|uniref:Uncharacterized protein n=1 Tax=Carnegiea gigantea TaxID=171969 RepID=A0A9Q1JU06_9CARY|nr:hypothetical protein Cgig2_027700 [Carnegiea gigantea]
MIELVRDAKEFFKKGQISERCPRYFSIFSHPPDKSKQRLPINCENQLLELCDKWQISRRKQIHFFIVGKDKSTLIGQIVEELDRDGNVDANRDRNGQRGVAMVADLTEGHHIDHEDNLWDDIVASIDEVQAVGELRNKCSSFPSLEVVLNIDKGQSIDAVCNPIPPAVQTDKVTKTATKVDKGKEIMIEEEHIHKGKGIMFPDGVTDSDDDIDEDELFEHSSEDEVDRYERMYAGVTMWKAEGDGEVILKEGDMFEEKKQFLDEDLCGPLSKKLCESLSRSKAQSIDDETLQCIQCITHMKAMEALHKLSPVAHNWLLDEPKEH